MHRTVCRRRAVLIVHRLSQGGHRYYLAAVGAAGTDAPDLGEAPGRWSGTGAASLQLEGIVDAAALRAVLPAGPGRVPGFDLTFAAPKSVSVLHGLAPAPVAAAIRSAHDEAVVAGLAYLEHHGCAVRAGGHVVGGGGFVVAAFRHRVSRANDPHLHTHALVANQAEAPDGTWRAIHSPLVYSGQRGAGAVYQAALRHRLSLLLGLTWEPPVRARCDAREVPVHVRRAFSRRAEQVLAQSGGRMAQRRWAERVTRPARPDRVDMTRLVDRWEARALALGWRCPDVAVRAVGEAPPPDADALPDLDRWTRGDLVVAVCDRLVDGAPPASLAGLCDRLLADERVVALGRGGALHASPRFTTTSVLRRQQQVREALAHVKVVPDHPLALDSLRRTVVADGGRMLIVAADPDGAAAIAARTGALGVAARDAAPRIAELALGPADTVAVRQPGRLPSADVEALLRTTDRRGVAVVATSQGMSRQAVIPPRLHRAAVPAATIAVRGGDITVAPTATFATSAAVSDWLDARRAGRAAVLVAEPEELGEVNAAARAALRAIGRLGQDEVSGLSRGDVLRFVAARPRSGIERHELAEVVGISPAAGALAVRLAGGRHLQLHGPQLQGVRVAHAVPPVPPLVAGRGEVFVVGGRDPMARQRGPAPAVHRYVTVDVPWRAPELARGRDQDVALRLTRAAAVLGRHRDAPSVEPRRRSAALAIGR